MSQLDSNINKFLIDYNLLISKASIELGYSFSAIASPTLNKQETISFLYKNVNDKKKYSLFYRIRVKIIFLYLLFYNFVFLILVRNLFEVKIEKPINFYFRTWLVPKTLKNNQIVDDYFRELINDLSSNNNIIVGFQPLNLSSLLVKFKRNNRNQNFIIPIGLLSNKDIFELFYDYLKTARIKLSNNYFLNGVDIKNYINQSLEDDFYKFRSFFAFLEAKITQRIINIEPKNYVYIYENQSWEKANLSLLSKAPIKTIGYQSSGFSFRFLNFFPTKLDMCNMYFPDQIYTVGDHYTNLLMNYGNYPAIIKTFSALRFNYLFTNNVLAIKEHNPIIFRRIVYAFSVHKYQYDKIFDILFNTFSNSTIEVILKLHPLYSNYKFKKKLPANFVLSNTNSDLNSFCDFVLFNDNSYGLEALIEGVKSYQLDFGEKYPENRLINFTMYRHMITDTDLHDLKHQIENNTLEKKIDSDYLKKYLTCNYSPYISDKINDFF